MARYQKMRAAFTDHFIISEIKNPESSTESNFRNLMMEPATRLELATHALRI